MRTVPYQLPRRRGVTAMLAMLYLVLFSTLAVGFYAAVGTSVQVVGNERRSGRALLAAESGMEFMRYHLADMNIPRNASPDELFSLVFDHLVELEGSANFGPNPLEVVGDTILVPWIDLDSRGTRFRAIIERSGQQLVVTTVGGASGLEIARGIEIKFSVAERASTIFDYGVVSRGQMEMANNVKVRGASNPAHGSVLVTSSGSPPLQMLNQASVSGAVSFTGSSSNPISAGGSTTIGGYRPNTAEWHEQIHYDVPDPAFPEVDTDIFVPYAQNLLDTDNPGPGTYDNIRIPAGLNPTFSGGTVLRGVLYIESPNEVRFSGNATVQGVIVSANDSDDSGNLISFGGTVTHTGTETLPEEFGSLRELTGGTILAPGFAVHFGGNFDTYGSIIAETVTFAGNAGGTIRGSVLALDPDKLLRLSNNANLVIESQGTGNYPAGVFFGSNYVPLPGTYREVIVQ